MKSFFDGGLKVETGDITALDVDAVVNAANSSLMGGGGVDGAIHRAGGPAILEECKKLRRTVWPEGLPAGKAVITTAGRMRARHVIHTVGPVWYGGGRDEEALLAGAYRNSISLAEENGLASLAFPAISTGVYGFPQDRAARFVASLLKEYFGGAPKLKEIRLVFFSQRDEDAFLAGAEPIFTCP
ncbi:MAG: O-acetyl-ADP-ribose deacetylase [Spirochaetales bacterium]|jgi:O-acetyl-ADP-ribose deacetylase (regulator of RNase III)|nr:O-acetyl-ADP-ribose deacetylase [Spirochaetales bacterium]